MCICTAPEVTLILKIKKIHQAISEKRVVTDGWMDGQDAILYSPPCTSAAGNNITILYKICKIKQQVHSL